MGLLVKKSKWSLVLQRGLAAFVRDVIEPAKILIFLVGWPFFGNGQQGAHLTVCHAKICHGCHIVLDLRTTTDTTVV
jgi:hypothetical protein